MCFLCLLVASLSRLVFVKTATYALHRMHKSGGVCPRLVELTNDNS